MESLRDPVQGPLAVAWMLQQLLKASTRQAAPFWCGQIDACKPAARVVHKVRCGWQVYGMTPYEAVPVAAEQSRLVTFDIDETARTVRQVAAYEGTGPDWPVYGHGLGDADHMPITGNILGCFGLVLHEGGVTNLDRGHGEHSTRIVEFAADAPDDPVLDLRIWSDVTVHPGGWSSYRVHRIPSLESAVASAAIAD